MAVALGAGPAVKVRDQGMIADPRVKDLLLRRADEAGLAAQPEILELGSTDAMPMQVAGAGRPAGCVSIPARYIHTPSEMVDLGDVQGAVDLLLALLSQPIEL
jgi:endoglucanase